MGTYDPIQTSFSRGELSPRVRGRIDSEAYKEGLALDRHFIPTPQGSLLMRSGTRHMGALAGVGERCRLIEFPVVGKDAHVAALGGGRLQVYSRDGEAVQLGAIDAIRNGAWTYGWAYWSRAIYGFALVTAPGQTPAWVEQYGPTYLDTQTTIYRGKAYLQGEVFGARGTPGSLTAGAVRQSLNVTAGDHKLAVKVAVPAGVTVGVTVFSGGLVQLPVWTQDVVGTGLDIGLEQLVEYPFSAGGMMQLIVEVRVRTIDDRAMLQPAKEGPQRIGYEVGVGGESCLALARVVSVALQSTSSESVGFDAPWSDEQLAAIQRVSDTRKDRTWLFHPEVAPYELVYESKTGGWTFGPVGFTPPAGGWEWEGGYPASGELYQGRLWLAGVPGKSNTFWASKSGDPYDFTAGNNAGDSFALDVSTKGAILWLQGHRQFLLGTDRESYSLTAQGGPITPSNFHVTPESAFGSAPVQAQSIGEEVLYISPDRRKVRAIGYTQEDGYQARELSFAADHITANQVEAATWAPLCDTLFALLRNGELVACTYNKAAKVNGWYRLPLSGVVLSIEATSGPSGSLLWAAVRRDGVTYLEQLPLWDEGPYLDACVTRPVAGRVVSGLGHLEGKTVGVVLDGGILHPDLVVAGGQVTLSVDAATATVGLRYRAAGKLLPLADQGQRGSTLATKRRRVRLALLLNDSAMPLVNGQRVGNDRTASTPMGSPEPRFTGKVQDNLLGWEDEGGILIEQDLPVRTEILAVFGSAAVNEV